MINTSDAYKQMVRQNGRRFSVRGNIAFQTGATVSLTNESFMQNGIRINDSTSAVNEFTVGTVAINKLTATLKNYDGRWSSYDFSGAALNLEIGLLLPDGTTEWLYKGRFTVYEPVSRGGVIVEVTAKDNMQQFDRKYDSPLVYPATLAEILEDACTRCGVVLSTHTFLNSDYSVAARPTDDATTYRDVVSYVAQLAGCWARCNNLGELVLGWYDTDRFYQNTGDAISGGNFTDAEATATAEGTEIEFDGVPNAPIRALTINGKTTEWPASSGDKSPDNPYSLTGVTKVTVNGTDYALPQTLWSLPDGTADEYDVISGSGTQRVGKITVDGSADEGWAYSGQINSVYTFRFSCTLTNQRAPNHNEISDKLIYNSYIYGNDSEGFGSDNVDHMSIRILKSRLTGWDDTWTNAQKITALLAWLAANPVTVLYQLAAPATITGTPQTIPAAQHNTISNDGGGMMTVTYPDDILSGGNFTDPPPKDTVYGGVFRKNLQEPAEIKHLKSCTISTDDVRVTGVQIIPDDDSKTTYFKGAQGYVISIEKNPLAQDNLEQLVANIAGKLVDFRFRPMQVSALDDPAIEAGDVAWVTDPKGHRYQTIISNLTWSINSYETFSADAETQAERQQTRFSAAAKAVQAAKQQAARQISTYDLMVRQLAETIALAAGTFQTVEKLEDGSQIVYLHDKPTLEESQKIWKHTANAFAVSSDGGTTWSGMTAEGNIVASVLTVIGINADWINTGKIVSSSNPRVFFDLDAGMLCASRLVSSDTSGIYADIGTEEPQYGSAKGFFLYDAAGKFAQLYRTEDSRRNGAQLLSLGSLSLNSCGGIAEGAANLIAMDKGDTGEGYFIFRRALLGTAYTDWLTTSKNGTVINFNPSSGHSAAINLLDNRISIATGNNDGIYLASGRITFATGGTERGSIDSAGWHGIFNIANNLSMTGHALTDCYGIYGTGGPRIYMDTSSVEFSIGGTIRGHIDSNGWNGWVNGVESAADGDFHIPSGDGYAGGWLHFSKGLFTGFDSD